MTSTSKKSSDPILVGPPKLRIPRSTPSSIRRGFKIYASTPPVKSLIPVARPSRNSSILTFPASGIICSFLSARDTVAYISVAKSLYRVRNQVKMVFTKDEAIPFDRANAFLNRAEDFHPQKLALIFDSTKLELNPLLVLNLRSLFLNCRVESIASTAFIAEFSADGPPIADFRALEVCSKLTSLEIAAGEYENLNFLASMPELEVFLDDEGSEFLTDLTALETCTKLKHLELNHYAWEETLLPLVQCSQLVILTLGHCDRLRDISLISSFRQLQKLTLDLATSLTSFEGLEQCPLLEELTILTCQEVDFSSLTCTTLRSLEISLTDSLTSLLFLQGYVNLTKLVLYSCKNLLSLEGIEQCPNLADLNLASIKISTLRPLLECKALQHFSMKNQNFDSRHRRPFDAKKALFLSGLKDLPLLRSVNIDKDFISKERLFQESSSIFRGCDSLEEITINAISFPYLDNLASLPRLISLNWTTSDESGTDILATYTNLERLHIGNKYIENITFLKSLSKLRILELDSCPLNEEEEELPKRKPIKESTKEKKEIPKRSPKKESVKEEKKPKKESSEEEEELPKRKPKKESVKEEKKPKKESAKENVFVPLLSCVNLQELSLTEAGMESLEYLEKCLNLTKLRLARSGVKHLRTKEGFPNMQELILFRSEALTTLEGLENMPKLKILDISGAPLLEDVQAVQKCMNLEKFVLVLCPKLKEIPPFKERISLQEITLENLPLLEKFPSVIGCNNLLKCRVISCFNLKDVSDLRDCAKLKSLDLRNRDRENKEGIVKLDCLRNCPEFKELDLFGWRELHTYDMLMWCTSLVKLTIRDCAPIRELDLSACHWLTTLEIHSKALVADLNFLKNCPYLRSLILLESPNLKSLAGLENHSHLEDVNFENGNLSDIRGLKGCTRLRDLTIKKTKLTHLQPLKFCPALRYLDVSESVRLSSLDGIQHCSKLECLVVPGTAISSLDEIKGCPILKTIDIHDCPELENEVVRIFETKYPNITFGYRPKEESEEDMELTQEEDSEEEEEEEEDKPRRKIKKEASEED